MYVYIIVDSKLGYYYIFDPSGFSYETGKLNCYYKQDMLLFSTLQED